MISRDGVIQDGVRQRPATVGDLIFLGPPGAGKGTQAKALVQENGWIHLSTGELFRDHIRRQTALGRQVKALLAQGSYVPDDVTVGMVRERLVEIPRTTRIVFDGFPRTVAQAESLEALLPEFGRRIGGVLVLEAPRDELVARLAGRSQAEHRPDDDPDVVARRLDVYDQETRPLISFYEDRGLVRRVDGVGNVPDITARLREAADAG